MLPWQTNPLVPVARGRFLVPGPLPERLPYVEPVRRRLRVRFAQEWVADSENAVLLYEPGHHPVAYFPIPDVRFGVLEFRQQVTVHPDLGATAWYAMRIGDRTVEQAAWHHIEPPAHAREFADLIAFSWRAMDGFREEDEPITGHAPDPYHRVDIRATSRELVVLHGDRVLAKSTRPVVLYESGRAPCVYVPWGDVDAAAFLPSGKRTSCPHKGIAIHYDLPDVRSAAWSYQDTTPQTRRVSGMVSFDTGTLDVRLDGRSQAAEPAP